MAYEVAQIVARLIDGSVVVCDEQTAAASDNFTYSGTATFSTTAEFLEEHTADDLLVINPSFQAPLYSLKTRCRTISYVQGYKTFWHLDPCLDLYVSASRFIADCIRVNDRKETRVIHPFLPGPLPPPSLAFAEKTHLGCVNQKGNVGMSQAIGKMMREQSRRYPELDAQTEGDRTTLLEQYARSSIFFTGVVADGFGLMPLEAMHHGCIVVGLDAHGSADYLRYGENSFCLNFERFRELPGLLDEIAGRLDTLQSISDEGRRTAAGFTYEKFEARWTEVLREFL